MKKWNCGNKKSFGTVASGIPFLLKENGEKVLAASRDQLEIAKVLVKDDEEKNRLIAAGNDYNFVTNVDEILNDDEIKSLSHEPLPTD